MQPAGATPAAAPAAGHSAAGRVVTGPAPKARPARPVVGERVALTGRAPRPARFRVVLQHRAPAGWRVLARTRTGRGGTYAFSRRFDRRTVLRVVAARHRARGPWRSARRVVAPVQLPAADAVTLTLTAPDWVPSSGPLEASAQVTAAAAGTSVLLETQQGDAWVEVSRAATTASGAVRLPVPALAPGNHLLRASVTAPTRSGTVRREAVRLLSVLDERPVAADPTLAGDLPRVDITTDDGEPVRSKTVYSRGRLELTTDGAADAAGAGVPGSDVPARFRVRGNSTSWAQVKLPYKVKLDTKTSLLGMPASKDWVLLANFYDRSLLRNEAAFAAARRLGVAWSPRMHDVEVYLNGTYAGVYQLGEGIEVQQGRVELGVAQGAVAPGPYLLEADSWDDDGPRLRTSRGLHLNLKDPDADPEGVLLAAVTDEVQAFEDRLYGDDFLDPVLGYRRHVDLQAFADWYLVQELTKNNDANFLNSVWIERRADGRFAMGPPWDYDLSAGAVARAGIEDPEGWFVHLDPDDPRPGASQITHPDGHWINRMLQDPVFVSLVQHRWARARSGMSGLPGVLGDRVARLGPAAARNFAPEPEGAGLPLTPTFLDDDHMVEHPTWQGHADGVVDFYARRIAWLDSALPTLGAGAGG